LRNCPHETAGNVGSSQRLASLYYSLVVEDQKLSARLHDLMDADSVEKTKAKKRSVKETTKKR